VYFTGTAPFGDIASGQTMTGASGAAFVMPGAGTFDLGGVRVGIQCDHPGMQPVTGALIVLTLSPC
jgi:hypothetical protein